MNNIIKYTLNLVIFMCAIIVSILLIELLLFIKPQLIPDRILYKMSNSRVSKRYGINPLVLEKLDHSPWVKFKPNVTITDAIRPHEVNNFVGKWTTDSIGFKNPPNAFLDKQADAITLGDSHVEGVGVSPSQTFASILSSKYKIHTYNLGVQGYGPQQMLGAYSAYGTGLKPKFVVFCYNGSLFKRAASLQQGQMTGRIASRLKLDEKKEKSSILNESVFLTTLKMLFIEIFVNTYKNIDIFIPKSDQLSKQDFNKYLKSYLSNYLIDNNVYHKEFADRDLIDKSMEITKECIMDFYEKVKKDSAIPIIFVMPTSRYLVELLYPDDYREKIKGSFVEVEYNANDEILMFCKQNRLHVIDGIRPIREYLRNYSLDSQAPLDCRKMPFFKVDGHPSQIAHEIYADTIFKYLSSIN